MATDCMTADEFEHATGRPLASFARDCHRASIALVKSAALPGARVLRGTADPVAGQHSWVAIATKDDVYKPDVLVFDPTLWSYTGEEPYVWVGLASDRPHLPHGHGSIWSFGRPNHYGGDDLTFDKTGLSSFAVGFLELLEPLDMKGWSELFMFPMEGWPAGEIIEHVKRVSPRDLAPLIPIDRVGMLTDLNPQGLYLP